MIEQFNRGDAVVHRAYGRGMVVAVRHRGYEVQVSFGRFSVWVPAADLTRAEGGLRLVKTGPGESAPRPAARGPDAVLDDLLRALFGGRDKPAPAVPPPRRKPVEPVPTFVAPLAGRSIEAAIAIEAFRMGLAPASRIADLTVGREEEIGRVGAFLHDEAEGAILIEGAYGAGKSHLLQFLAERAIGGGFAVATCGFDPSEAGAAFPKKTYRRLVQGFRAPVMGRMLDFRGFMRAVAASGEWGGVLSDHPVVGQFFDLLAAGEPDEEDWSWIEGRANVAGRPPLHDHSTCANIYCNLLSCLSRAAVEVLGLSGLVVLLDEAEVARNVMYSYQAARGINLFRGLVLTANDEPVLLEEGLARGVVTAGTDTGLIYSGFNPVRYTTGIPSYLKIAFALTPGTLQAEFRRCRESIGVVHLECLTQADLRLLFSRICDRFLDVYGIRLAERDRERLFRLIAGLDRVSSTRGYIKAAVEALDYLRFYPRCDVTEMIAGM